ncbi:MAG: Nif11-like leader peptide family natural product precursor, partial [Parasynechococcus sp.]
MALDQLKSFLLKMQNDPSLKQSVLASSTADDVAKIGNSIGYE